MLDFFRKYQRYFFSVIAVVIIISFSFFGTGGTLGVDSVREGVAFTAIDGTQVKRSELDDMVTFLSTDSEDKFLMGGIWGPNFLNDGVFKKDFFETNLAPILAQAYSNEISNDLLTRLEKEKKFALYTHPQAKFISVESVWGNFAPSMKSHYEALKAIKNPTEPSAFETRVSLYLGSKQIPGPLMSQVLRYQEKQFNWLTPDPMLERMDLSLFGYHTVDDWFGPHFTRIMAEFIINAAKVAESKGYSVSNEEVISDLVRNSEISFRQNGRNPQLGVATNADYLSEQLRRMGMDEGRAMRVWRQVLLFRRLFSDVGNAIVVDPLSYQKFNSYAMESVQGDMYRLPEEARISSFDDLQKLETYLNAVSKRGDNLLEMPTVYLSVEEVAKKTPELVQKKYSLEVASVTKNSLQAKVSLKDTWNWEVEDKNWEALKKQFPDVGAKKANTREERLAALDSLDDKTRSKVDAFARSAIVDSHPEWLSAALDNAQAQKMDIGLRTKGGNSPFAGLDNREELMKLLDSNSDKLKQFTADNKTFYRINVLEKASKPEIMTYDAADKEGVLMEMRNKELEAHYTKIRDTDPDKYQKEDKTWKPFNSVQDQIAESYYAKILKAIQDQSAKSKIQVTNDLIAAQRMEAFVKEARKEIQKSGHSDKVLKDGQERQTLHDQWKLVKSDFKGSRGDDKEASIDANLFDVKENTISDVYSYPNGDVYFMHVKAKGVDQSQLNEKIDQLHQAISNDAQRHYMTKLTQEIKDKGAISLNYMNAANAIIEEVEDQQNQNTNPL